jgi:hypothetical protein
MIRPGGWERNCVDMSLVRGYRMEGSGGARYIRVCFGMKGWVWNDREEMKEIDLEKEDMI